jgi:glycosyltransferase involved in cell wall biosynthesis
MNRFETMAFEATKAPRASDDALAGGEEAGTSRRLVSIVVCTRNRADKLRAALEAIRELEVPADGDYEVIVVDNGSTDATPEVCASLAPSFGGRLRRVFLATPGLSRAGNAGFEASRGSIIAFLDDDLLPGRDWLVEVCREFAADPDLGAISGRVELFNPADLPMAIRRQTERIAFDRFGHAFTLFIGCNLAVRRSVIDRIGLFDPDLGTGTRFGSAGDSDFFYRAWRAGEKLVFVPTVFVLHDHSRRTPEAKLKVSRDYVVGRGALYAKHVLGGDRLVMKEMYWELRGAWRSLFAPADELGWRHGAWLVKGFLGYSLMRAGRLASVWRAVEPASPSGARPGRAV